VRSETEFSQNVLDVFFNRFVLMRAFGILVGQTVHLTQHFALSAWPTNVDVPVHPVGVAEGAGGGDVAVFRGQDCSASESTDSMLRGFDGAFLKGHTGRTEATDRARCSRMS